MFLTISMLVLSSCKTRMDNEAMQIIQKMTLPEKIGQMLMPGVPGKKISKDSISIIEKYLPGGIILFGYNIGNAEDVKNFIRDIQQTAIAKYNLPLFISIDQEGGRVKRITNGVTQFPGNMAFGVANDESVTHEAARILGMELRLLGINMNLAPVLDVNNNPLNPVINTRSFGSDVKIVSRLGASYIEGLQKSKCIAVAKHFPGHGDTDKDSHLTLPVIHYGIERLRTIEFPPFIEAIDNGVEGIMTAHISFPNILKDNLPATISKRFLTEILRKEMHFEGIIITDDMEMNAISKMMNLGEAAVKSVQAGADVVLISTHGESIEIISRSLKKAVSDGRIPIERINESVKKIIEIKLRYNIMGFKDGKINYPEFNYSDDELEIAKKAEELNSKISREAVYFYSNGQYPLETIKSSALPMIFISLNDFFRKEMENNFAASNKKNNKIFRTEKDFLNYIAKEKSANIDLKKTILYYHFDNADPESIEKILNASRRSGIKPYLLCTGNPFPLGLIKTLPPTLCTFSNANESIKQMVSCLKGEFKPREKINLHLGFAGK